MTEKYGHLQTTVDINYAIIRRYVRTVVCDSFWIGDGEREYKEFYDPFEQDRRRVSLHNTVAAVFDIPRNLVSECRETVDDGNGGTTDIRSFYSRIAYRDDAIDRTVDRFIDRLVKAWHEFHEQGKYKDMVDFVADSVWVEKAAAEVNALEQFPDTGTYLKEEAVCE